MRPNVIQSLPVMLTCTPSLPNVRLHDAHCSFWSRSIRYWGLRFRITWQQKTRKAIRRQRLLSRILDLQLDNCCREARNRWEMILDILLLLFVLNHLLYPKPVEKAILASLGTFSVISSKQTVGFILFNIQAWVRISLAHFFLCPVAPDLRMSAVSMYRFCAVLAFYMLVWISTFLPPHTPSLDVLTLIDPF